MTYTEFRKTYHWMLKQYPRTDSMYRDTPVPVGNCIIENYEKRGTKWILTDSETETGITNEYYCNCVDAIPFFRNLGGYERVSMNYTKHGYIPTEIISISPDRQRRVIRKFKFD